MRKPILAALTLMVAGCGSRMSTSDNGAPGGTGGHPGSGGSSGTGVAGAAGGGAGGAAPDGGPSVAPGGCPEHPAARAGAEIPITIKVELSYAGNPVSFGEPFPIEGGGTLTLTNFRFYVSSAALRLRSGTDVPVDLVGAEGAMAPYGVVLVNAEDPAGMTFQIAAPAGDYGGLSFLVGIPDECNGLEYTRNPPLSAVSQMTWPAPFGYLFLRYAGKLGDGAPVDAVPALIDMGGFPRHIYAPRSEVASDLKVAAAQTLRLTVALEQLFRAALMPADLDDYARALGAAPPPLGTAQINGQHVLHNLGAVAAFSIAALP